MSIRRGRVVLAALTIVLISIPPTFAQEDEPGQYAGRDAAWWVGQLGDREAFPAALVAFRRIGRPALEPLADALFSEDRRTRDGALSALRQLRLDLTPVLQKLVEALDTADLRFAGRVLGLIETIGRPALPHLDVIARFVSCGHRDASTRALGILVMLAPESRRELPRVLALAAEAEPRQRRRAVETAIRLAPADAAVVRALATELGRATDRDRRYLLVYAKHLHPGAPGYAALVVRSTKDSASPVRLEAARRLEPIVLEDVTRLGALIAVLGDADSGVRRAAAKSVQKIGTVAAPAVAALTGLLENGDPLDDLAAVNALSAVGPEAGAAWPAVLRLLEGSRPSRDLLRAALGFVVSDPARVVRTLESDSADVRRIGMQAVCGWSPGDWSAGIPAVLGPIQSALLETSEFTATQRDALLGLSYLAATEPRVTALFVALARAKHPDVRGDAARHVGGHRKNLPLLMELLGSADAAERAFALRALRSATRFFRDAEARKGLWALLRSENEESRKFAARILVWSGPGADGTPNKETADALAGAAAGLLSDPELHTAALVTLTRLGASAIPHLHRLFDRLGTDGLKQANVRVAVALRYLASTDEAAKAAVMPRAAEVLRGKDAVAAAAAAHILIHDPQYDSVLFKHVPALMRDERKEVHFNAVQAAQEMGKRAGPLVPVLLEIATEPPGGSHVDSWAINALSRIDPGNESLLKIAVAGLLDRKRQGLRAVFLDALRRGGKNAALAMANALAHTDAAGKLLLLSGIEGLGRVGNLVIDRVKPLVQDPDPRVSKAASEFLRPFVIRKPDGGD